MRSAVADDLPAGVATNFGNPRKPLQDGSAKRQKQRQAELAMASDF